MADRGRVVIVGGGFGGLTAARALAHAALDVTVVDRQNHHLFQPLLYQVAMAGLAPSEIAAPIRSVLSGQRNVRVLLAEVTGVDLAAKRVHLAQAAELPYDYLVLAPGARTHYFGHDDWAEVAPGLKDLDDAVEIRRRVLLAFEAAEREPDPAVRARLLSFVVIGGGPTGVELAGAIAELSRFVLSRDFRTARPSEARVLLVEGGPRLLPSFDPQLSEKTVLQLSELGVHVRTGTVVEHIHNAGVTLKGGEEVGASTVLWAAGVSCSPLIGDAAAFLDEHGQALPGVSPTAMQMGRYVAAIIARESGAGAVSERAPFRYVDKGSMATIGRSRAIAQVKRLKLSGMLAWLAWLLVHIWYLIGFRNRLLVMFDWAMSYFTYRRGARLITGKRLTPGAPGAPVAPTRAPNDAARADIRGAVSGTPSRAAAERSG